MGILLILVCLLALLLCVAQALIAALTQRRVTKCREAPAGRAGGADEEQPAAPRKLVAVIGGGLSGLVSCKRLREQGLDVVGFERADQLGGIWVFREGPAGKTYSSLRANVHKGGLQMEDFPMPETWPQFPSHWQLNEYLQAFAKHFALPEVYRLKTEVLACRCGDQAGGGWTVTYRRVGAEPSEEQALHVDAVCMCVGQACTPFIPTYPGQELFEGRMLHTVEYRDQSEFIGKRVLVIGAGAASGTDVAQDLSFGAKQVFLSVRRGMILLPRFLGGQPNGEWFERNFWSYVPLWWLLRLIVMMLHMVACETFGTGSAERHGITAPPVLDVLRTGLDELRLAEVMATDCCNLTQRVAMGAVRMRPALASFTETGARFADGSVEELDAVVWATGFRRDCTGLGCNVGRGGEQSNRIRLWRRIFHPSLPNFACCLQTHPYGSHWAVADMQARWIAEVFADKLVLPPCHVMEQEAAAIAEHQREDICLDCTEIADVSLRMGRPRPSFLRLVGLLASKPVRTCRWLMQPRVSRRITVDECAEPADGKCKFETVL